MNMLNMIDGGLFGFPKWDPSNYFTIEIVLFIASVICLVAGILICFWGYKYLMSMIAVIFGGISGAVGMRFIDSRVPYPLLNLFLLVGFVFLGECLLFAITTIVGKALNITHTNEALRRILIFITPFIGAGIVAMCLYLSFSTHVPLIAAVSLIVLIAGVIYQVKTGINRKKFHTYDEIYKYKNSYQEELERAASQSNE